MMARSSSINITTAPFLRTERSTNRIMFEVMLSLIPIMLAAMWYFGISALLVVAASVLGAAGAEYAFMTERKGLGTLRDGSALLTGLLLGLTLPPALPLWMAFLGGAVGIALGKLIWGGLGQNLFNPALVGRAFLQATFPVAMTTWVEPGAGFFSVRASTMAAPLMQGAVDGVSVATPLSLSKFEHKATDLMSLLLGNTGGSLGETCALLLVACAVWLIARGIFEWRLCVSTVLSVALFSGILYLINPALYPSPQLMVLSGGLLFGAVYMVTDPVTTPLTSKGAWIFGSGVGFLVVLIRLFGGLTECVMFSILLMNAVTPHINRFSQSRKFGG